MGTIKQKLDKLLATKEAIRQAIVGKGQSLATSVPFSSYPDKIAAIQTGIDTSDATAAASDIASGKTAYVDGEKVTGIVDTTTTGIYATSPAHVNTSGDILLVANRLGKDRLFRANSGTEIQFDVKSYPSVFGTATQANVLSGKSFTSSVGRSLTGTMPTKAATTITPGTSAKTAISAGTYASGAITVAGDTNLKAANIKAGVSIFGVTGSYTPNITTVELFVSPSTKYNATIQFTAPDGFATFGAINAGSSSGYSSQMIGGSYFVIQSNSSSLDLGPLVGCVKVINFMAIPGYNILLKVNTSASKVQIALL